MERILFRILGFTDAIVSFWPAVDGLVVTIEILATWANVVTLGTLVMIARDPLARMTRLRISLLLCLFPFLLRRNIENDKPRFCQLLILFEKSSPMNDEQMTLVFDEGLEGDAARRAAGALVIRVDLDR